jgi:hypothetical protein
MPYRSKKEQGLNFLILRYGDHNIEITLIFLQKVKMTISEKIDLHKLAQKYKEKAPLSENIVDSKMSLGSFSTIRLVIIRNYAFWFI